jgi:hypothetical protein
MQGFESHISELRYLQSHYAELKQLDGYTKNWNVERVEIKKKFPVCSLCKYCALCEGPWKEYETLFGSDEFKPVKK